MFNIPKIYKNFKHEKRHNDLLFLPEITKIEEDEKRGANLHDEKEYVIHIRNSKQELNQRLVLKTVHKVINSN